MRILFDPFATTRKPAPASDFPANKTQTNFKPDPKMVRLSCWHKNH